VQLPALRPLSPCRALARGSPPHPHLDAGAMPHPMRSVDISGHLIKLIGELEPRQLKASSDTRSPWRSWLGQPDRIFLQGLGPE
jgi:hypothetical protein